VHELCHRFERLDDVGYGGRIVGRALAPTTAVMLEFRQRQLLAIGSRLASMDAPTPPQHDTVTSSGKPLAGPGSATDGTEAPRQHAHSCTDFEAIDAMCVSESYLVQSPRRLHDHTILYHFFLPSNPLLSSSYFLPVFHNLKLTTTWWGVTKYAQAARDSIMMSSPAH
jgi:hypothetical protein